MVTVMYCKPPKFERGDNYGKLCPAEDGVNEAGRVCPFTC